MLGEYQRLLVPIIQKHNGSIDKFMGDGIMASFGAVTPSTTYAVDALSAVDEIIQAVEKWSAERNQQHHVTVSVGMGLAIGEVIFGIIGNEERLEYTVIGEAANLAAKLEKQNKVEHSQALTTASALMIAQQQGYTNISKKKILNNRTVAGVENAIDLVVLA